MDKNDILRMIDEREHLAHWGIKGQKWGVRRFQNEDGSLTPEGRKRYGVGDGNDKTETKDYHEMSDQELSEALRRKRLENQYVNLKLGDPAKSKKEKIEFIKEAVSTTNKTIDLVDKTILESQRRDLNEEAERLREENRNNKDLSKEQRSANEEEIKYYEDAAKNINLSKDLVSQSMNSINAMVDLAGRKVIKNSRLSQEKVAEVAKDISEMSNDELQRQVNRMLMEKQYDQLMNPPKESNWVKGREVLQTVGSVIGIIGGTAGIVWTSMKIAEMIGKATHNDMNDDVLTHYAMMGEDFLAHYGVKGQKRGIRRWQNEDGSLTPEGYRHYGIDPNTERGSDNATISNYKKYRKDIYKNEYASRRNEGMSRSEAKNQANSTAVDQSRKIYGDTQSQFAEKRLRQQKIARRINLGADVAETATAYVAAKNGYAYVKTQSHYLNTILVSGIYNKTKKLSNVNKKVEKSRDDKEEVEKPEMIKKEKMREEMSGIKKVNMVLNKIAEKNKQEQEEQKRYNEIRTRQDERARTGSRDPIQEVRDRIDVERTPNRVYREDRYQVEKRRRNRGNI